VPPRIMLAFSPVPPARVTSPPIAAGAQVTSAMDRRVRARYRGLPRLVQVCGCCRSPSLPNIWLVRSNKVEGLAKGGCNPAIPVYSTPAPSSRCHRLVCRLLWFMDAHHAHNPKPNVCLSGRCRRLGYGLCMDALGDRAILQAASQYRSFRLAAIQAARGKRRAPVLRLTRIN
jgi:hypothetical protein